MPLEDLVAAWTDYAETAADERESTRRDREAALPAFREARKGFLERDHSAEQFRFRMQSLSQHHNEFGFGGGAQMFLNQLVRSAAEDDLAAALRRAFPAPDDAAQAEEHIGDFAAFVEKLRAQADEAGTSKPALGHIPFFLTFFWEMEDRDRWPIYYPNSRDVLEEYGALDLSGSMPENYARFRATIDQLKEALGVGTWDVEGLLWHLGVGAPAPSPSNGDEALPPGPQDDIYAFYAARDLVFPEEVVTSFLLSLRTKGFVILSGISGTGKTQLAINLGEYLSRLAGGRRLVSRAPEDDEQNLFIELTAARLKLSRTALRRSHEEVIQLPPRGTSRKMSVALPNDETGELRLNNIDLSDQSRNMSILFFQGAARDWLRDTGKPGQFLHLTVDENGEITQLDLVVREMEEEDQPRERHALIPVRSDWTDPRGLLGFYNPLLQSYVSTPLLDLILAAEEETDQPHVAVLDEMNLARVEYYFSDFLSAMESGKPIPLRPATGEIDPDADTPDDDAIPEQLHLGENVLFVGTVNVDETTHAFSPKVLDRANVIEFDGVDIARALGTADLAQTDEFRLKNPSIEPTFLLPDEQQIRGAEEAAKSRSDVQEWLREIHALLAKHRLHFGYRVIDETCRFIGFALEAVNGPPAATAQVAFDLQIVQKVLPKFAGGRELQQPLSQLREWCIGTASTEGPPPAAHFPRAVAKIDRMLEILERTGYVAALG